MWTIYKKLNVSPNSYPLVIPIKQYSSDFILKIKLYSTDGDLDIEAGAITKIRGTKRDGNGFELTGTRIGNTCTFSGTKAQMQQMTAAHGRCVFEIVVEKNTKELITANFYLEVQRAAMDAGTVISESIIEEFEDFQSKIAAAQAAATAAQEQAERAEAAAESVGRPTDEQAQNAVDNWLDEHPEATTTVQDGSITEAKLATALKPKVLKDYVTPEMFGAVGDGETDDTSAVTQAFASGKPLFFSQFKTYRLTDDITFHQSVDFNSATILLDGCSLIVDDGLSSQNHYGFGIIIKNGFFIGDNTNTIIKIQHSTKTTIEDCSFKDFLIGIYIVTGYEHNIDSCRFIGSDTIHATAIRKNDGDGYINNLTGVNCYNALIIVKGKHLVNNIHFWLNSGNLLSGSAMIVYSGAGQSNLKIDYAYFDGYEVGIRKSGLSTLNLNNSNIVMPAALLDGDYYLFDFADANQDFCVAIDNFSTPWSNESNFKLSKDTQKAIFYMGYNKMSYAMRNIVRYYNSDQLTFLNGVTATDVRFTLDKNLLHLKGTITVPSDFTNSKKALTITGIYFPIQHIAVNGQYGTEKLSFTGTDMYILNSPGQTLDVDVVVSYLPQYS